MLRDVLSIGDKIDVKRLDHMGRPLHNANTYVSQLADFVDKNVIHIAAPIRNGIMMIPETGENYNLCFYTKNGLYQCNCTMLNNSKENNTVVIEVKLTSDLEKFQRRQYYRLEFILDMKYHPISQEEEILINKFKNNSFLNDENRDEFSKRLKDLEQIWYKASIIDISGGGAKFNSSEMHKLGNKMRINLGLELSGRLKTLNLEAVIISSNRIMNHYGAYENRVEFYDIGKSDREDLIRYIFEQDRKLRKNIHS